MPSEIPPPSDQDEPTWSAEVTRARQPKRASLPVLGRAQYAVLGGIFLDAAKNDGHSQLLAELDLETDDFSNPRCRALFNAFRDLEAKKKPIDLAMVEAELERVGKLDMVGFDLLGEVAITAISSYSAQLYAAELREASQRRRLAMLAGELGRAAANPDLSIDEVLLEHGAELARLSEFAPEEIKPRWALSLVEVLGDQEPDDDDSGDWILRDVIPRAEPTMLAGAPKTGKTWLALDLALDIALGGAGLGGACENTLRAPANVLVIALEDAIRRLRRRLWELCRGRGITPNHELVRQHLQISTAPLSLPDPRDTPAFIRELKVRRPKLVIVDNISRVLVGDPNSTKDAAAFGKVWHRIGPETDATLMFLHHTRKPSQGGGPDGKPGPSSSPTDDIRGSGDLVAGARHIMVMRSLETEVAEDGPLMDAPGIVPPDAVATRAPRRLMSELLSKGNLDLRVEAHGIELVRDLTEDGRPRARIVHVGSPKTIRAAIVHDKKKARAEASKTKRDQDDRQRWEMVRALADIDTPASPAGTVSSRALADRLGCSARSAAEHLANLAERGLLIKADKNMGYRVIAPKEGP